MSLSPIHAQRARITDVWTPAQLDQLDALVAACVLVSHADGWVTVEERGRMLERMRGLPVLAVFGIDDALEAFEALDRRFEQDPDSGRFEAESAIRRLRGREAAGRLVVNSACAVAVADGGLDAEERDVLLRICSLLALSPIQFDLIAAGSRR
ncbi:MULTISPECIES: tellurite resistance TerB family protein [unclassified Caulobacter]|uniref:tellurite resistance TerB family protein n=1 Tax=unclassified Caulobacter TaxID=2648921 RepID=UPI000D3B3ABB|nr:MULTISPECIES: tellurite resistance TerB family protein [unclassified Caulobacter]PTS90449.1 tellurite resistance terb [Caulobacter sp. HMWF009]PTT10775.1 tellurite resistance terb [Caulobacter sp. HMWF025]PTT77681.1 tellurite resistance terb [Pseudomonas sp. HMWF010]